MFCKNCGCELEENAVFCNNCGAAVNTAEMDDQSSQQMPAGNLDMQQTYGGNTDYNNQNNSMNDGYNNMNYNNGGNYNNMDNNYNNNNNNMGYQQNMPPRKPDNGGFGWCLLGFCIPIVGLILWLVWKDEKPITAKAAGKGALISVIVAVIFYVIYFVILVGFAASSAVIL